MSPDHFVDHYEILQVSQNADPETIERVFRLLAKRYHPDNKHSGDPDRFRALTESYRVLSDPISRAEYDATYENDKKNQWGVFMEAPTSAGDEDRRIQRWIMSILFNGGHRDLFRRGIGFYRLEI